MTKDKSSVHLADYDSNNLIHINSTYIYIHIYMYIYKRACVCESVYLYQQYTKSENCCYPILLSNNINASSGARKGSLKSLWPTPKIRFFWQKTNTIKIENFQNKNKSFKLPLSMTSDTESKKYKTHSNTHINLVYCKYLLKSRTYADIKAI